MAIWVAKDPNQLHADSEDSDQTGRMPRLIFVLAGHIGHFVGFDRFWLFVYTFPLRWSTVRVICRKPLCEPMNIVYVLEH